MYVVFNSVINNTWFYSTLVHLNKIIKVFISSHMDNFAVEIYTGNISLHNLLSI